MRFNKKIVFGVLILGIILYFFFFNSSEGFSNQCTWSQSNKKGHKDEKSCIADTACKWTKTGGKHKTSYCGAK